MPRTYKPRRPGTVTSLQSKRLEDRRAGKTPKCGSPLANSGVKGHKNYGRTCNNPAGAGTDHVGYGPCNRHIGSTPNGKKIAAQERVHEQVDEFRRQQAFYGARVSISFEGALLEELQRSVGIVRWIEGKLSEWGGAAIDPWNANDTGMPRMGETLWSAGVNVAPHVFPTEYSAWLDRYLLERKHLAQVAKDGIASGIAKQMIQIYQHQADLMQEILRRSLVAFGIDRADERIPRILPGIVREVVAERQAG